jgi:hypothetical protein
VTVPALSFVKVCEAPVHACCASGADAEKGEEEGTAALSEEPTPGPSAAKTSEKRKRKKGLEVVEVEDEKLAAAAEVALVHGGDSEVGAAAPLHFGLLLTAFSDVRSCAPFVVMAALLVVAVHVGGGRGIGNDKGGAGPHADLEAPAETP